jgi:hypothetical protein
MRRRRLLIVFAGAVVLTACSPSGVRNFEPKQLAKADIDRVADAHRREVFSILRTLTEKLYRRNPREWQKYGYATREVAIEKLFDPRAGWRSPEWGGKLGTDAVTLALQDAYTGDRVAAFIGGLGGMLNAAFENKTEFFMLDELDPQKLYNSARNIETAAWKLAGARDMAGTLLLLANELPPPPQSPNLSFEREFGKLIGHLDMLARLIAEKENRTISKVAQGLGAFFIPIPGIR